MADDIVEYLYKADCPYWEGCALDMFDDLNRSFVRVKGRKNNKCYKNFRNFNPVFQIAIDILLDEGWKIKVVKKVDKPYELEYEWSHVPDWLERRIKLYPRLHYKIDCKRLERLHF